MPTMSNSHWLCPAGWPQMGDWMGMRSPIFHLKRSAVVRPTMAPVRVVSQAFRSASVRVNSGNMARKSSGTTGMVGKKFFGS